LVLSATVVAADDPPRQIDPAKREELKEKLKNLDPEQRKQMLEKFGGKIDPEKRKQLAGRRGGAAANVDIEGLFKKHDADKDGKLSLEETKKLYDELKEQMGAARGQRLQNLDPAKLEELKKKLKDKQ
jgi:hypothetical protein